MKRCARCDRRYEDEYDGCPYCARGVPAAGHATVDSQPPARGTSNRPKLSGRYAPAVVILWVIVLFLIDGIGFVLESAEIIALVGLVMASWVIGSWFWAFSDMGRIADYQDAIAGCNVVRRSRGSTLVIMILIWIVGFPTYLAQRNKWLLMTSREIQAQSGERSQAAEDEQDAFECWDEGA